MSNHYFLHFLRGVISGVLLCVFTQMLFAQGAKTETEKWREDLRYLAEQMPLFHKDLFHQMTREQFDTAVKKLYDRIPALARHQIIVEMKRMVAWPATVTPTFTRPAIRK